MPFVPANPLSILFSNRRATPTSINEHFDTLHQYALSSQTVCELGVDTGQSTTAFLHAQPERLFSFDLLIRPEIDVLLDLAAFVKRCPDHVEAVIGKTFWILQIADSSKHQVPPCDLLFIDTWHAYPQLKAELELNHTQAAKFIILHDTQSFGTKGEGWQDWERQNGSELQGLWPAILEFLAAHPEWRIKDHFAYNNGLTILGRQL